MSPTRSGAVTAATIALLATACRPDPVIERVPSAQYTRPSTAITPTSSPTPTGPVLASGTPGPTCVRGWLEPSKGTAFETEPLDALRRMQGFSGSLTIVELRYFLGPDDANLAPESKQKRPVERWYGKVTLAQPPFRIRFLYVRREIGAGVVAIAPFGTKGFAGKDWMGFDGEGGARAYPGVPGKWPGTPYDYRAAGELPPEVAGCLAGT